MLVRFQTTTQEQRKNRYICNETSNVVKGHVILGSLTYQEKFWIQTPW